MGAGISGTGQQRNQQENNNVNLAPPVLDPTPVGPSYMYLLLEVGCIECGEGRSSCVRGITHSESQARSWLSDKTIKYPLSDKLFLVQRLSVGFIGLMQDGQIQLYDGTTPSFSRRVSCNSTKADGEEQQP